MNAYEIIEAVVPGRKIVYRTPQGDTRTGTIDSRPVDRDGTTYVPVTHDEFFVVLVDAPSIVSIEP